jgi:hypothetical protein
MADLEDAYSDLGGRSYSLPSGTSGLSSYGQRVYGRPVESVSSIDTDLQTERALLAVEQQKASAVRQLRDTALASMNLREKNRIEEQAGYVASKLTDIDPHADDFENQITTLYSQFPYGFRDQAINSAINFKRDIRKQYDLVNQNMQREENLQARAAQRAEDMQTKAQQEQEFREYQTFSKSLSPFYQQDFLAEEEKAKQAAKAEGREFGMEDRRGLMASFTQRQAQEKVEQDLKNADLNPDDFRTDSGFDYAGARKALFDFGKRDKQMSEARSIITALKPSIDRRQNLQEEVPQEELNLLNKALSTMTRLMDAKGAATPATPAAPPAGGEAATAVKKITSENILTEVQNLKPGDRVQFGDAQERVITEEDIQKAAQVQPPKEEVKLPKLEGANPFKIVDRGVPATNKSKVIISTNNPIVREVYPAGIDIQGTVAKYTDGLRNVAESEFDKQVAAAQMAGKSDVVRKFINDKKKLITEFAESQLKTNDIQMVVASPLLRQMAALNKQLQSTKDPQELAKITARYNEIESAKKELDFEVYKAIDPEYTVMSGLTSQF